MSTLIITVSPTSNVIAGDGNDGVSEEGSSVTGAAWGGPVYSTAIEYFISSENKVKSYVCF